MKLACVQKKTGFLFFLPAQLRNPDQVLEQQKSLSWILLKQNKFVGAPSEIRESTQEDKKTASKPGDKLENNSLRSRRQQESTEQMEQQRQTRNDSLRSRRQLESAEQLTTETIMPDKNLTDNADKDSDWPILIPRQPLLIEFKSDLLTQVDHHAICSCVVFIDKTKR